MRRRAWFWGCIAAIASSHAVYAIPGGTLLNLMLLAGIGRSDLALSPDGKICAIASSEEAGVFLWDAENGKLLRVLKGSDLRGPDWAYLAFSPDGRLLVFGTYSVIKNQEPTGAVELFEVSSGTLKYRLDGAGPVCFSADGKLLATGGLDNALRVWDVATGQMIRTLRKQERFVTDIAASPDGSTIVSTDGDKSVRLWNIRTGEPIPVAIKPTVFFARSAGFSPDGTALAIAGMGEVDRRVNAGWVELFDVQTGKLLRTLVSPSPSVEAERVAFDPSGEMLAGGMNDGTAVIWEVASGRELRALKPVFRYPLSGVRRVREVT